MSNFERLNIDNENNDLNNDRCIDFNSELIKLIETVL